MEDVAVERKILLDIITKQAETIDKLTDRKDGFVALLEAFTPMIKQATEPVLKAYLDRTLSKSVPAAAASDGGGCFPMKDDAGKTPVDELKKASSDFLKS